MNKTHELFTYILVRGRGWMDPGKGAQGGWLVGTLPTNIYYLGSEMSWRTEHFITNLG